MKEREIKKSGNYDIYGWESIRKLNKMLTKKNKLVNGILFLRCTSCGQESGGLDCYGKCHICTSAF